MSLSATPIGGFGNRIAFMFYDPLTRTVVDSLYAKEVDYWSTSSIVSSEVQKATRPISASSEHMATLIISAHRGGLIRT